MKNAAGNKQESAARNEKRIPTMSAFARSGDLYDRLPSVSREAAKNRRILLTRNARIILRQFDARRVLLRFASGVSEAFAIGARSTGCSGCR